MILRIQAFCSVGMKFSDGANTVQSWGRDSRVGNDAEYSTYGADDVDQLLDCGTEVEWKVV
jgi:hypothetical protein